MTDDSPIIETRDNGPFVVRNIKRFRLPDGSVADTKPVMALCRCGQSKNKPFCDGSHKDAGFDSAPGDVAHRDRVYSYAGADVTVYYNKLLCSHAGECGRIAKEIFNPAAKPWVQPDNGTVDQVKQVIATCPSGALRLSKPEQEAQAINSDTVEISVEPNGPYHVTNIEIAADFWGEGQEQKKYVLCRCGLSGNKPFCDGTHHDRGWTDGS